ncbi:putative aminopeptidase npepl1 [Irineochytrium annulatum]|nr:putative aminopeptidase npepl1 [Irineochytrium annulatum]
MRAPSISRTKHEEGVLYLSMSSLLTEQAREYVPPEVRVKIHPTSASSAGGEEGAGFSSMVSSQSAGKTSSRTVRRAMFVAWAYYPVLQPYVGEFLGTLIFVLIGIGSVSSIVLIGDLHSLAIIWGIGLAVSIYATASVSGAHLNPAISLTMCGTLSGFYVEEVINRCAFYMLAQFLGGFVAGAVNFALWQGFIHEFEAQTGLVRGEAGSERSAMVLTDFFPNPGFFPQHFPYANGSIADAVSTSAQSVFTSSGALAIELLGTAILAFMAFALTDPGNRAIPRKELAPFFIGLTLTSLISLFAPLTSASFNPARDVGPRIVASMAGWGNIALAVDRSWVETERVAKEKGAGKTSTERRQGYHWDRHLQGGGENRNAGGGGQNGGRDAHLNFAAGTGAVLVVAEKANINLEENASIAKALSTFKIPATATAPIVSGLTDNVRIFAGESVVTFATFSGADKGHRNMGIIRSDSIRETVKSNKAANKKGGDLAVVVRIDNEEQALAAALAVGAAFPMYTRKTDEKTVAGQKVDVHVHLVCGKDGGALKDAAKLQVAVDSARFISSLVDMPPNELHVDHYVELVRKAHNEKLKAKGVTMTVIEGKDLEAKGYGLIWGVGKASEHLPALVILSHTPAKATKTVAFVGKGIVYDTGGLSIKGSTAMPTMKTDMGGSAGVLGGFMSSVLSGAADKFNLHAVICLAENSVGPLSTRPDDVHIGYSGKSVEINNTDAEGRLVLGDGVAHVCKHINPDYLIDMATLTGASAYASGQKHAGVLSNSAEMENTILAAGRKSGDLCFPLIYAPEFHGIEKQFKSTVADMKNSVKERQDAQSSSAGFFIQAHMSPEGKWKEGGEGFWAHVDMAFPVTVDDRAVGWGVGLLTEFSNSLSAKL